MPLNTFNTKAPKVHQEKQTRVVALARLLHEAAGILPCCSANSPAIDLDCRNADAARYGLPGFTAGANAFVEFQVIADHRNPSENIGAVSDQCRSLDRSCDLPIFNQICFGRRKNELPIRNVHLPAAEVYRVTAMTNGAN